MKYYLKVIRVRLAATAVKKLTRRDFDASIGWRQFFDGWLAKMVAKLVKSGAGAPKFLVKSGTGAPKMVVGHHPSWS